MTGFAIVRKDNTGWAVVVAQSLDEALEKVGWDRDSVRLRERVPYQGHRREAWIVAHNGGLVQ